MEDIDDDFGELYADIELQSTSEINGVVSNTALQQQQQQQQQQQHSNEVIMDGKRESENGCVEEAEKRESDSETSNNGGDKLELEDESYSDESDDDFDVVVNDEDIGPKSGGGDGRKCGEEVVEGVEAENVAEVREGSLVGKSRMRVDGDGLKQSGGDFSGKSPYKYIRREGPANVENQRALCSWKADREDVWYGQARMSGFAPGYAGHGSSFWLPWYRTIVDVDIDMFEQKSWTHPEADITDYFNFGFDEESWRNYCRSLGKLRRQTFSQTRNQGNEVGATKDQKSGRFVNAESMSLPSGCRNISSQESEFVTKQFKKQIGQAIHVEDSKFERQSSADARRPRNLDSDVVIQITGQDSENHCGSGKEERDNNPEIQCDMPEKGLGHGNVEQDDKLGGFKACEMGKTFVERPFQSSSLSSDCKRSCESASHMLQDFIAQGKDQKSDIDVQHFEKADTFSEENPRVIQTLNSSTEDVNSGRDTSETDPPSVAGIDLSFEDHGPSCLSPSSNAWSETSKDDDYSNLRKTRDLRRSSSASTKERHHGAKVDHLCLRSERDDRKVKESGGRYHLRVKNSPKEGLRHNEQRIQRHFELNNHTDDSDNCQIGIAEHRYGVGRSRSRHRGREEFRLASPCDDAHWPHYRKNKPSIGRYDRRSVEDRLQPEHMRKFDRQNHWRAKDEVDLVYLRELGEEQFLSDKRMQRVRGLTAQKDWCLQERECMIRDEKPVFQNQENFMMKHSSSHDVNLFKQRTEYDGVHFPKRSKKGQLSQFQYSGGPVLKRFGKHNLLDRQQIERKYLDSEIKHERQLWHSGREVETSGGVDEYFESSLDVDCPWYTLDDDEYWNGKPNHLDRHHMYLDSEIKHERWLWHSGREVGTFGRGDEYFESTLGVDYPRYSVDDEDYWNGQTSISIHDDRDGLPSFGEVRHQNTLYRDDTDCPRLYQSYERRRKSIFAKKGIVSRQIYDHRDACNIQDVAKYLDEDDYFENERIIFQSKGSWTEDTLFDGGYDKDSYDENMLDSLNGTPRHKWIGSRHGFVPGGMAKQTKKMKGRFKVSSDRGGKSYTMMPKKTKHDENGLWGRNSVALHHTVKRKTLLSHGKFSKAGAVPNNDACQQAFGKLWEQPKRKQEQDDGCGKTMENKAQNNELIRSKLPVTDHSNAADLELEEGQIPTEEPSTVVMKVRKSGPGHVAQKDAVKGGHVTQVYDEKRILETMAKMEKRKERFKEPIHAKKDMDFDPTPEVDKLAATTETKGQKPARKRKWG